MVKLDLQSIAYEAKTLNLAKEGSTTYYVDGADGLDIHDGGSWAQAFKTIQHAIDESESWTKIFVKAGTYNENVVADEQGISLIGEKRSTTIINVSSGTPVDIRAEACKIESMKIHSGADYVNAIDCQQVPSSKFTQLINIEFDGKSGTSYGPKFGSSYCTMRDCHFSNANMVRGLQISTADYCKAYNNFIKLTHANSIGIYGLVANNNILFENELDSCRDGINIGSTCSNNSIFHNNFIGNTNQTVDQSPGNDNNWFENFYDDHITDTNNDGICDTPYSFVGNTDYQPVSKRGRWKQGSLGISTEGAGDATEAKQDIIIANQAGEETISSYNLPNDVVENTVIEITNTKRLRLDSVWIDFVNLVQDATIKVYHKIDGTNERKYDEFSWATSEEDGILLSNITINSDWKLTVTSTIAQGAIKAIPYNVIKTTMEA